MCSRWTKPEHSMLRSTDPPVKPEEPVSSPYGLVISTTYLRKDFSFGDQFLNDKPSEAGNEKTTTDTEAESMVSVTIQQDICRTPSKGVNLWMGAAKDIMKMDSVFFLNSMLTFKLAHEQKIERLTATLHSFDSQPSNKDVYYAEDRMWTAPEPKGLSILTGVEDEQLQVFTATLGANLAKHRVNPQVYIGCMKSGPVLAHKGVRYHEPEHWKSGEEGNKYFRHATGQLYAISKDLATYISRRLLSEALRSRRTRGD
ncbi:probable beta-1,3-galactosyltransferase 2 isoform X1 [Tanacetum coccineum]|uniref:Probable beta-1,3-galactosyltransferase 2 isoform X1 n=1 Tax=Tanacetum coccineum TaxID=301880 RepID=A0ABQ5BTS5_9ASTR